MGFFDDIKKKTGELVDGAGDSFDSLVGTVKDTADSVASSIENMSKSVADVTGQAYDSVADATTSAVSFLSEKSAAAKDDLLELLAIKFYELINKFDFDGSLKKLNEEQAKGERDITPLIDFVKKLKDFAEEGKNTYGISDDK